MEIEKIKKTQLEWSKFEPLFGTWASKIKPFFDEGGFDPIYKVLKESSLRGVKIAPISSLTYRIFKEVPLDKINVIVLGYCPYHTFVNGSPIADGIGFSSSVTGKLPPSLEKMYEGWEEEFDKGMNLSYYKNPDLLYLAKQGIFLLNSSLTVPIGKAGAHQELWRPFMKYLIENVFAYTGIPIILVGKDAQFYNKYVTPLTHGWIFKIEHPAFAARNQTTWETDGLFTKINRIVKQTNGIDLKWLCSKEEMEEILTENQDECPF